jgi:DNA-binding NtrC family response regulator
MSSKSVVLIIEDEPAITRILNRKLIKLGYETKSAPSLKEASDLLSSESPKAIFLDYVLEDGRSSDLVSSGHIKPEHRVFLMSAFMDDLEKDDFKGLNVTFLKKPFENLDEILKSIE